MQSVLEFLVYLIFIITCGLNSSRYRYYKKRVNIDISNNLKTVARNIARMVYSDKKFKCIGEMELIKNGAVLYSVHFGVWELMPQIVYNYLKKEVGILVNRYTDNNPFLMGKLLDRFFYYYRFNHNVRVFYPDEVYSIVKFIKNGGIFAALVDGNNFFTKFKKIEKLARLCKAPLIPFAVYCENGITVMQIGCNLEELVRKRPYDYWWFYKSRRTVDNLL